MSRILLMTTVALVTSFAALASEPPDLVAACRARYSSLAAVQSCVNDLRFGQVEVAQEVTNDRLGRVEAGQDEIRDQLSDIQQSLDEMKTDGAEQTAQVPIGSSVAQSRTTTYSTERSPTAQVGGAPYRVVPRPSLVSVYSALTSEEADTLHVTSLEHENSARQCGGIASDARILVTNHGTPVPVWAPQGVQSGFSEIYADLNGDGQPDPAPYKTLDPTHQDDLFVTWRSGDDLRVVYLREAGRVVSIPDLPLQTLWRPATREDGGPRACRPATASYPGGHHSIQAFALWRVW
jgi:hypothetical protein